MTRLLALFSLSVLASSTPLVAQSLADIAAEEQVRRKQIAKTAPVYTNKDIKPSDRPEPVVPAPAGEVPSADPAEPGTKPIDAGAGDKEQQEPVASGEDAEQENEENGEQQWRARMNEARAALERNQMFAEALQSRINALWADFTARDDPAQRAVIETERKKALAQLDRVKAEIVAQTKAIADIEEEARRAGIPPGWLR